MELSFPSRCPQGPGWDELPTPRPAVAELSCPAAHRELRGKLGKEAQPNDNYLLPDTSVPNQINTIN